MKQILFFSVLVLLPVAISKTKFSQSYSNVESSQNSSPLKFKSHTNGCYYGKPKAVLEKICKRGECRKVLNRQLDVCVSKIGNRITKGIKYKEKVEYTHYLNYDIMDDVLTCMSQKEGSNVSGLFPYKEKFTEVDYKVRSKHFEKQEKCLNKDCSRKSVMHMRPIIGETKNLYYPF